MFAQSNLLKAAFALGLGLLAGCGESNTYVPPPPPAVTVAPPVQRTITRYLESTGNTAAVNTANLVARVSGFVQSIGYKDGEQVKKGAVLFTIEPESYELKLKQSEAAQDSAKATVVQTEGDFQRQSDLAARGSASKAALDNATASRDNAQANLKQAEINTRLAAINYGYTRVEAPFDGSVTARKVSVGDYVGGSGSPTVLATIVQIAPIYVNFSINEQDVLRIRAEIRQRGLTQADLDKVPVEVGLQTETGYPHKGTLNYRSPTVDASTGTLAVRGDSRQSQCGPVARPTSCGCGCRSASRPAHCWCRTVALGSRPERALSCWWSTKTMLSSSAPSRSVSVEGNLQVIEKGLVRRRPRHRQRPAAGGAGSEGRPANRARRRGGEVSRRSMISKFFIERPGPRQRHRDPDCRDRRGGAAAIAGGAISRRRAADRAGDDALSRRQRPHRHRHRGAADRAAGQRRRRHDLHAVLRRRRRLL